MTSTAILSSLVFFQIALPNLHPVTIATQSEFEPHIHKVNIQARGIANNLWPTQTQLQAPRRSEVPASLGLPAYMPRSDRYQREAGRRNLTEWATETIAHEYTYQAQHLLKNFGLTNTTTIQSRARTS
ncbi:hypothetical protein DFH27DRAFT_522440 [Peziza echinospora]|nr:hypothetical protein DFH27DRAFT_522440 [Peziza echinospora]